jgi:hypothetical protein
MVGTALYVEQYLNKGESPQQILFHSRVHNKEPLSDVIISIMTDEQLSAPCAHWYISLY